MLKNNYSFDWQNIKILHFKSNYYKRIVSEMIHIKTQGNGLNSVDDIECLDSFLPSWPVDFRPKTQSMYHADKIVEPQT